MGGCECDALLFTLFSAIEQFRLRLGVVYTYGLFELILLSEVGDTVLFAVSLGVWFLLVQIVMGCGFLIT